MAEKTIFPIVIPLSESVRYGEDDLTELSLRKPLGGDYRQINNAAPFMAQSLDLAAELANVPKQVIDRLCQEDVEKVVLAVNPFLFWFHQT